MNNTQKQIADILKRWVFESPYTQKKLAKELGTPQPVLSRQLNGIDNISIERIRTIIEILLPPKEEVSSVLKHYVWKNSSSEKKSAIEAKAKEIMNALNNPAFDRKLLDEIMDNHEEEVLILRENGKDRLLVELLNAWVNLNKAKKLKILTYINELEN